MACRPEVEPAGGTPKNEVAVVSQCFQILEKVSSLERSNVTSDMAHQLRKEFNEWLYSAGGMAAEASTRAAIIVLREAMATWASTGLAPDEFVL